MAKIKIITALGINLGEIDLPKKMVKGFIESYFKTKSVESYYLFIDGKEITDGKNYNPYYHKKCSREVQVKEPSLRQCRLLL